MRVRLWRPVAVVCLSVLACDTPRAPSSVGYTTIDSAGTRFVRNELGIPNEPWIFREDLRIGMAEGADPYLFVDIRGMLVDSAGRVFVLDYAANEIRVFDPEGTWQYSFGRMGGGPGELRGANRLAWGPGNTVWVHDHGNNRISVFNSDGRFLTTRPRLYPGFGFTWAGLVTSDTTALELVPSYGAFVPPTPGTETSTHQLYVKRLFPDNTVDSSLIGAVSTRFYRMPRGAMPIPFQGETQHRLHPDGSIWRADADSYRLTRLNLRGDPTLVVEQEWDAPPVSASARDSAIAAACALMARLGTVNLDWSAIPSQYPAIQHFFVDDTGRLWVAVLSSGELVYHVFDASGVRHATVTLGFSPLARPGFVPVFRDEALYAVVRDALDITYVVRAHRID